MGQHDPVLVKMMHGRSADERSAFFSMLKKDAAAHKVIATDYIKHWEADGGAKRATTLARSGKIVIWLSSATEAQLNPSPAKCFVAS